MSNIVNAERSELQQALVGKIRLYDQVDAQNGFIKRDGNLALPAEEVIAPIEALINGVPQGFLHHALIKYDTHFKGEYAMSPESDLFPYHCGWNEQDWQLSVDIAPLESKTNVVYLMKNVFDMFGDRPNGVDKEKIVFSSKDEEFAYDNLFTVTPSLDQKGVARDAWLDDNKIGQDAAVIMTGVAADYCCKDTLIGYLNRGCTVIIPTDTVKGIQREMRDVIASEKDAQGASFLLNAYKANKILLTDVETLLGVIDDVHHAEQSGDVPRYIYV